jgi:enamine deaminase RidA (YjgF/YER057c/UK114 family)
MTSVTRIEAGPRMSQAVIHGDTVYLAGQVAAKPVPSVEQQTKQILTAIDKLLKKAGSDKTKILKANIWLSDIRSFSEMNKAWDAWVVPGKTPARATVESRLAGPQYLVEIMVTAAR